MANRYVSAWAPGLAEAVWPRFVAEARSQDVLATFRQGEDLTFDEEFGDLGPLETTIEEANSIIDESVSSAQVVNLALMSALALTPWTDICRRLTTPMQKNFMMDRSTIELPRSFAGVAAVPLRVDRAFVGEKSNVFFTSILAESNLGFYQAGLAIDLHPYLEYSSVSEKDVKAYMDKYPNMDRADAASRSYKFADDPRIRPMAKALRLDALCFAFHLVRSTLLRFAWMGEAGLIRSVVDAQSLASDFDKMMGDGYEDPVFGTWADRWNSVVRAGSATSVGILQKLGFSGFIPDDWVTMGFLSGEALTQVADARNKAGADFNPLTDGAQFKDGMKFPDVSYRSIHWHQREKTVTISCWGANTGVDQAWLKAGAPVVATGVSEGEIDSVDKLIEALEMTSAAIIELSTVSASMGVNEIGTGFFLPRDLGAGWFSVPESGIGFDVGDSVDKSMSPRDLERIVGMCSYCRTMLRAFEGLKSKKVGSYSREGMYYSASWWTGYFERPVFRRDFEPVVQDPNWDALETDDGSRVTDYKLAFVRDMYVMMDANKSDLIGLPPIGIAIAQAAIESNYGRSYVYENGNNLFGIKCHNWSGEKVFAQDDEDTASCFRAYPSTYDSIKDYATFLRTNSRYDNLPWDEMGKGKDDDLDLLKRFAIGLKQAGYATSDRYSDALISFVETVYLPWLSTGSIDDRTVAEAQTALEESKPSREVDDEPSNDEGDSKSGGSGVISGRRRSGISLFD